MNVEELKHSLREIFVDQIIFNNQFDYHAELIKNVEDSLISWCNQVKERKIQPISKSVLKDKIVFIKKIGSSTRCIIIKIVNDEFKEIHLGDHTYYNKITKELGLKKSSNTY
ncbi:TPA: hypothetical protein HA297_00650 [Candidatus Woesearchaeota archaeon]|nr:hypothetical protein [Candidatus Woesearchaeota archaeon]